MALWFAALLGLVQGLTEFLPISSTAHLRIAPELFGQADPGAAFTAVLQLGTLVAVCAYFWRDLFVDMPRALFTAPRSTKGRLPIYLVLGTIPIVIAGLSFKSFIVGDARSLYVIAGTLIGVGLIMAVIDGRREGERSVGDIGLADALIVGGAQALALVPGVSRSGATICAALVLGFRRTDAARFSFLLGIPAIAGAGIFEMKDAVAVLGPDAAAPLAVGMIVAMITGYASIAWLLRWLGSHRLVPFSGYRIILGGTLIALCQIGVLSASAGAS